MKIFGWDLGCKRSNIDGVRLLPSYTLAEVVIVMLVIAVVVAVSIRITKAKLDSIVSYTYYSAYSTLKGVTRSLLSDFDKDDEDYMAMLKTNLSSFSFNIFPKAEAASGDITPQWAIVTYNMDYWTDDLECIPKNYDSSGFPTSFVCPYPNFGVYNWSKNFKECGKAIDKYGVAGNGRMTYAFKADSISASNPFKDVYKTTCNYPCYTPDVYSAAYRPISTGEIPKDVTPPSPCLGANCNCGFYPSVDHARLSCPLSSLSGGKASYVSFSSSNVEGASSSVSPICVWCPDGYEYKGSTNSLGVCSPITPQPECNNPRPSKIPCDKIWDDSPEVCGLVDKPGFSDACPINQEYDYDSCSCKPKTSNVCNRIPPNPIPCGKVWDNSPEVCGLVDAPHDCSEDEEWSESACDCVPSSKTVPRKGINFCEQFEARANTKSGETFCHGDDIATSLTDFSSKKPDMVLRNGMLLYNMHKDPEEINALIGNTPGGSFGDIPNTNSYGYTVYVDIDGKKGVSKLWEDVYPFYITLSGKVIPAYDKVANPDGAGADSTNHLQVSVQQEGYSATGKRMVVWLEKSVPFQLGACRMGYVGKDTSYCRGVSYEESCGVNGINCKLKIVAPIKFF